MSASKRKAGSSLEGAPKIKQGCSTDNQNAEAGNGISGFATTKL